jgi:hypothetical protein
VLPEEKVRSQSSPHCVQVDALPGNLIVLVGKADETVKRAPRAELLIRKQPVAGIAGIAGVGLSRSLPIATTFQSSLAKKVS